MRLSRILLITCMLFSTVNAKNYFINQKDICDTQLDEKCTNNVNVIRNLQIALSYDKYADSFMVADGKWGKDTKDAIVTFQENHNISPADGWVGKSTKKALDIIAKNIKFPKDVKIAKVAVSQKIKNDTKISKNQKNAKSKNLKVAKKNSNRSSFGSYGSFKKSVNLRKSFKVFKDTKLLSKANGRNTKLKIDISEQRLRLYVNGKVALCSPCTTGAKRKFEPNTKIYRDKRTPKGTFRITEKIRDKRSTIFGDYYRGSRRVYHGDKRKFRGSKRGLRYKGASLQNWMRLTSSGVGLHASKYVKRHPGTNGCIRLPFKVAQTVFKKVRKGTKVSIVN